MIKKLFTLQIIFVALLIFSSKVLAQSVCDVSITELKKKLIDLQKDQEEAERGIIESDRILMKAQEIILLARANGDVKAGQIAEDTAKKAEQAKNIHLKNKRKAEEEIEVIKRYIDIAQQNNFQCMSDVCNKFREQIARDKGALKRLLNEAETLSKRQNERSEEIKEEMKDFVLDIIPILGEISVNLHQVYGKILKSKRLKEKDPVKYKEILNSLDKLSSYYKEAQKYAGLLDEGSKLFKVGMLYENFVEIKENCKSAEEELEKLKQLLRETVEFLIDYEIDRAIDNLDKFDKKLGYRLAKAGPIISTLKSVSDVSYHIIKIDFLDEEVNRDYKLTDDLLKSYERLKDQLDKDMKKLKECENYSKKLSEKEESNE
jgi:molecular chaperone GrpE (heat shock protein)